MNRTLVIALAILFASASTSQADIIFTGAVDGDVFNDANYVQVVAGVTSPLPAGTIDPFQGANPVNGIDAFTGVDVIFDVANITGSLPAPINLNGEEFNISTNNLVVTGLSLDTDNGGLVLGGGTATVTDGAILSQFLNNADVDLSNSSLTLRGGGNPIAAGSTIDLLDSGATLNFSDETTTAAVNEHAGAILVGGVAAVFGSDPLVAEPGDNAIIVAAGAGSVVTGIFPSAIPEPTSAGLLAVAGLGCVLRRRR